MLPGELIYAEGDIEINKECDVVGLEFTCKGDRPVCISSFFDIYNLNSNVNISANSERLHGRLDIPSGVGGRLERGDNKTINIIKY